MTYLIKQVELAIRAEMDRVVRSFGVTTPQYTALSVLRNHPGLSSAQLARRSFVSAQAANEMVAALERKGLVVRQADAKNKRILEMQLTPLGASVLESCDEQVDLLEQHMLGDLSATEHRRLRGALEACVRSFHHARTQPAPAGRHAHSLSPSNA
jgi:DNA-binding MarR family transcriptional regulator